MKNTIEYINTQLLLLNTEQLDCPISAEVYDNNEKFINILETILEQILNKK